MKFILVKLFLELLVEKRRGPVQSEDGISDSFNSRLVGMKSYMMHSPCCIRQTMDELNEIGFPDEIIIDHLKNFISDFEKNRDNLYGIWYPIIVQTIEYLKC